MTDGIGDDYFIEYGFCDMEDITIRCYAHESHKNRTINGRAIADKMARTILIDVLTMWQPLLDLFGASLDRAEYIGIRDASIFDAIKETKIYIYEVNFKLRTTFEWNFLPQEYEEGSIMENIEELITNDNLIK
jgi:hypothetical protein